MTPRAGAVKPDRHIPVAHRPRLVDQFSCRGLPEVVPALPMALECLGGKVLNEIFFPGEQTELLPLWLKRNGRELVHCKSRVW